MRYISLHHCRHGGSHWTNSHTHTYTNKHIRNLIILMSLLLLLYATHDVSRMREPPNCKKKAILFLFFFENKKNTKAIFPLLFDLVERKRDVIYVFVWFACAFQPKFISSCYTFVSKHLTILSTVDGCDGSSSRNSSSKNGTLYEMIWFYSYYVVCLFVFAPPGSLYSFLSLSIYHTHFNSILNHIWNSL